MGTIPADGGKLRILRRGSPRQDPGAAALFFVDNGLQAFEQGGKLTVIEPPAHGGALPRPGPGVGAVEQVPPFPDERGQLTRHFTQQEVDADHEVEGGPCGNACDEVDAPCLQGVPGERKVRRKW